MSFCFHRFGGWRTVNRDEIGGQMQTRCCEKCARKQVRHTSNVSPLCD